MHAAIAHLFQPSCVESPLQWVRQLCQVVWYSAAATFGAPDDASVVRPDVSRTMMDAEREHRTGWISGERSMATPPARPADWRRCMPSARLAPVFCGAKPGHGHVEVTTTWLVVTLSV